MTTPFLNYYTKTCKKQEAGLEDGRAGASGSGAAQEVDRGACENMRAAGRRPPKPGGRGYPRVVDLYSVKPLDVAAL
jgi:hypothetical protein